MLSEQIRQIAHQCADEVLRRHRLGELAGPLPDRPGSNEWELLRELLEVEGEPAPGTPEHQRFRLAEQLFVESFLERLRTG